LYQANIAQEKIIKTLYDLEGIMPHNILVLKYLADLYLKHNNTEKALEYLKKTLSQAQDRSLKAKIYYQIALLYHDLENNAAMEQALHAGYKLNSSFAPLNNLLAYQYARSGKYDEAEKLIKTVIEQEKDNQLYHDTYGYILYKKKAYQQAATIFQTSLEYNPSHCCTLMHLGKVYAKLKQKDKAQGFLDKAMQFAHTEKEKNNISKIKSKFKLSP
jgi:predicted Zn-dependent protease